MNKDLSDKKLLDRLDILRANVEKRQTAYDAAKPNKHLRELLTEEKNRLAVWEKVWKDRKKATAKKKGKGNG